MSLRPLITTTHVLVTALASVATAHCSGCAPSSRSDGGVDAWVVADATRDVRSDAPNAPRDVVDVDLAAVCAQVSDTPEQWERLPFACDCDARIARRPENAAAPLRWTSCPDHADCLDLVADWRTPENASAEFEFQGREIDGQIYVFYGRRDTGEPRDRYILSHLDGPPLVAWDIESFGQDSRGCRAEPLKGPAFGLLLWWSPDGSTFRNYVSIGGAANEADWRTPVVNFLGVRWSRVLIPYVSAFGRDVAFSLGPTLWRSDPATREFVALARDTELQGEIGAVQLYGAQSWFLLSQIGRMGAPQDVSLWVVEAGSSPRVVYRPDVPRMLGYLLAGDDIVLAESEPRVDTVGPTVIRVARRTTNPTEFSARDVWRVPSDRIVLMGKSSVGGGWAALVTRLDDRDLTRRLVLIRLADGARFELGSEAAPENVAYVTADEVAFAHRVRGRGVSIRRIAIRSLGEPLPATR